MVAACYLGGMDIDKIKEASARLSLALPHIRAAADKARDESAVGLAVIMEKPDGSGRLTARFEADEFFADLVTLAAVPDLLAEIERLKTLAREGWELARAEARRDARARDHEEATAKLAEIGSPPARPAETIDLRVEGVDALHEAGEKIERLTRAIVDARSFLADECPTLADRALERAAS